MFSNSDITHKAVSGLDKKMIDIKLLEKLTFGTDLDSWYEGSEIKKFADRNRILDEAEKAEKILPDHDCHLSPEDGCKVCEEYIYGE